MPSSDDGVPKVHPASREVLPDDPMTLNGFEIPGDTELMLRVLVEEYARIGWGLESIMGLARDPNYTGFHGLLKRYGEEELQNRVAEILSRCAVIRVRVEEAPTEPTEPEQLVQLQAPAARREETSP